MAPVEGAAQYGCRLAPPLPSGLAMSDTRGREWVVGKKLGAGAFGAIYTATRAGEEDNPAEYVVKVEPHSNGPLFVEMHAFLRLGKEEHVTEWQPRCTSKPPGWVGIPRFHGAGSVNLPESLNLAEDSKLRFLVITRLGADLEKFFKSGLKPFPLSTVLNIGYQVLNSLEYVHSKGYCHNDIKAQNLLLDSSGCDVFLVDFGLACKFRNNQGFHCEDGPDERKAHEGTREYTSRDAHIGAHSRRGDLESLAYNLVHWATGFLPWSETMEMEQVEAQKNGFMEDIPGFLAKCFQPSPPPDVLVEFLEKVIALEFRSRPDYKAFRQLFSTAMEELGSEPHQKLQFSTKTKQRRSRKSDVFPNLQAEEGMERSTRSKDDGNKVFWQDVIDPVSTMKSNSRSRLDSERDSSVDPRKEAAFAEMQRKALNNPTPEMLRLLAERETREQEREALSWKDQLAELNTNRRKSANNAKWATMDLTPRYNTPHMEEVIVRRAERLAMDRTTPEPSDDEMDSVVREQEEGITTCSLPSTPSLSDPKLKTVSFTSPATALSPVKKHSPVTRVSTRRTRSKAIQPLSDEEGSTLSTPEKMPPNAMAASSKHPSCVPPGQVCDKILDEKSMARQHMRELHGTVKEDMRELHGTVKEDVRELHGTVKRALPSTPARTGFTPDIKRGKKISKSLSDLGDTTTPLPCHTSESLLLDSPAKNLRMADCPVCGKEMAKSLLPKHFDDQHSPSGARRGRGGKGVGKVEDVAGNLARVSVSSDSPAKIRNMDSPARPRVTEERVGRLGNSFRRVVTRNMKKS